MQTVNTRISISDNVVSADLDGEAVLLNIETGVYFGLDQLGTEIWKGIEDGEGEDDIFARLLKEYDVEPGRLRGDLSDFLRQLAQKGLIEFDRA